MKSTTYSAPRIKSGSLTPKSTPIYPVDEASAPVVYYTPFVWNVIWYLVNQCSMEVGWLGLVDKIGDDYIVTDIYVPEQTVSRTETDIESEAMSALALELLAEGKDPNKLRYWGHSHVNMQVSPSSQDEKQLEEYLEHCDWFIRGIYNKRGDTKVDVYDRTNNVVHQVVKNGPHIPNLTEEEKEVLDKLIKNNVQEYVYVPKTPSLYTPNNNSVVHYKKRGKGQNGNLKKKKRKVKEPDLLEFFDDEFDESEWDDAEIYSEDIRIPIY